MRKKFLIGLGLVLVVSLVVWPVVGSLVASRLEKSAAEDWARAGGLGAELEKRFPPTTLDAPTEELERLTAALGIDLVPKHVGDARPRPVEELVESYKQVRDEAYEWLYTILMSGDDRPNPVPAATLAWLGEHERSIADLETHVLQMKAFAQWTSDIRLGAQAPLPNLLGVLHSQKLLAVVAMIRQQQGDAAGAERALLVSWRLNQALRTRPSLISQLVYISCTKFELGALRKLNVEAGPWLARFSEHDDRAALVSSLAMEAYIVETVDSMESLSQFIAGQGGSDSVLAVPDFLARPYFRMASSNFSGALARAVKELQAGDACTAVLSKDVSEFHTSLPSWNILGRMMVLDLTKLWSRYLSVHVDLELTALVLRTRNAHQVTGQWPSSLPEPIEPLCTGQSWSYTLGADGIPVISHHPERESEGSGRFNLPATHSFEATPPTGDSLQ